MATAFTARNGGNPAETSKARHFRGVPGNKPVKIDFFMFFQAIVLPERPLQNI